MSSPQVGQRILRVLPAANALRREAQSFLVDRKARGLSEHTVRYYARCLDLTLGFLENEAVTSVEAIAPDHLRRFLLSEAEHRNNGGVAAIYRTIRTFLRWWESETEPEHWRNPIRKVPHPRMDSEPLEPVNLEDLRAMLHTCERKTFTGDRDRAMLLSLLDTGCRVGEFLALNLGDLDLNEGGLLVRRSKSRKPRTVFVGSTTLRELLRYLRHRKETLPGMALWVTDEDNRLHYEGLRKVLERRARYAAVNRPNPHAFRRGFAIASLRSGMDLVSIQRLLGHSDLSVISRYLRQTTGDLKELHARHSPVDKLFS